MHILQEQVLKEQTQRYTYTEDPVDIPFSSPRCTPPQGYQSNTSRIQTSVLHTPQQEASNTTSIPFVDQVDITDIAESACEASVVIAKDILIFA